MEKSRSPPKTTYEPPKEQMELEKLYEDNHHQGLQKLNQTRSLSYHHLQTEKTSKTQAKQAKVIEEYEKDLHFEPFRANPLLKSQV